MNTVSTKAAVGEAHSKLILFGEHAVVYGKPAIAIPFPLRVSSKIEKSIGAIVLKSEIYTGPIKNAPIKMKGISECIKETLRCIRKPFRNLTIEVESSIPIGRGLGSSAAIASAVVKSLFYFYEKKLSREELFRLVQIAETYAHGKPSGIDMAAVTSEGPILFKKEVGAAPLKLGCDLHLVAADTGRVGDTHRAVENVRKKYDLEPEKVKESLDEIESITKRAREALLKGDIDLLGKLMNANHKELITLGVSDEGLNTLTEKARKAGALGAKLTGGGLGGCIIALASSREQGLAISKELIKAGASQSWHFSLVED